MSAEGKKKRGISGMSNAKSILYRYVGGSHDHPFLTDPLARIARTMSKGSDHQNTSTFLGGMVGGRLAELLGYDAPVKFSSS